MLIPHPHTDYSFTHFRYDAFTVKISEKPKRIGKSNDNLLGISSLVNKAISVVRQWSPI